MRPHYVQFSMLSSPLQGIQIHTEHPFAMSFIKEQTGIHVESMNRSKQALA